MKRQSLALLAALSLMAAAGCGQSAEKGTDSAFAAQSAPAKYKVEDVDVRLVDAHTRFSFDVFREAIKAEDEGGNVFLSPLSAAVALSMTMNGAGGETFEAMREALRMEELSQEDINRGHEVLSDVLTHPGEGMTLRIANSLWSDEGLAFKEPFLAANRTHYGAEAVSVDLQAEEAVERINGWVDGATSGRIPKMLEKPLSADAILLLLNAIYFDADWRRPFPEQRTAEHPFRTGSGVAAEVPMMFADGEYEYMNEGGVQGVRLPYEGGAAMIALLPEEGTDFRSFAGSLTAEQWAAWRGAFRSAEGTVGLPKFQLAYESEWNNLLKTLGMGKAFDPDLADFIEMIDLGVPVYLSEVKQKAVVDVDEQGTVAAAVTSVEVAAESAPPDLFRLVFDRPFVFVIEDERTGSILFVGAVENLNSGGR